MTTDVEKLAALQERRAKLTADIDRKIRRLKNAQAKKTRQEDTRRKILAGAWLLSRIDAGEIMSRSDFLAAMGEYLNKNRDLELFGLSVTTPTPTSTEKTD